MLKTSVNHNLCIFYQNLCGLRTKLFKVRSSFPSFISYDIIILTKIWLSPVIYRNELVFDGFLVFRQHINSSNSNFSCSRGILIAVKANLKTTIIPPGNVDVEQAFITLTLDSFSVLVGMPITNIISTTHWFLLILCSLSLNLKFHTSAVEQLILSLNSWYTLFCGDHYTLYRYLKYPGIKDRLSSITFGCLTPSSTHLVDIFSFLNLFQNLTVMVCFLISFFSTCNEPSIDCAFIPIVCYLAYYLP